MSARERLQAWLDEDGQNWGQHECDVSVLLATCKACGGAGEWPEGAGMVRCRECHEAEALVEYLRANFIPSEAALPHAALEWQELARLTDGLANTLTQRRAELGDRPAAGNIEQEIQP